MESEQIRFPWRFFFFMKKKTGRSVSGEGWRGVYVGTVEKKNIPLCVQGVILKIILALTKLLNFRLCTYNVPSGCVPCDVVRM